MKGLTTLQSLLVITFSLIFFFQIPLVPVFYRQSIGIFQKVADTRLVLYGSL